MSQIVQIAGVNIPSNKRVIIALQYVYGIGPTRAKSILAAAGIDESIRVKDLKNEMVTAINERAKAYVLEGDLRREVASNIKRLVAINSYRGTRHRKGLPVRGQRTSTNARTRKGRGRAVAGKKKVTK